MGHGSAPLVTHPTLPYKNVDEADAIQGSRQGTNVDVNCDCWQGPKHSRESFRAPGNTWRESIFREVMPFTRKRRSKELTPVTYLGRKEQRLGQYDWFITVTVGLNTARNNSNWLGPASAVIFPEYPFWVVVPGTSRSNEFSPSGQIL